MFDSLLVIFYTGGNYNVNYYDVIILTLSNTLLQD